MALIKIDALTAVNLDAIASIKFSGGGLEEFVATVNFLSTGTDGTFLTETFTGDAAVNLCAMIGGKPTQWTPDETATEDSTAAPPTLGHFMRTKGWYVARGDDGRRYFIAFVNAKGSCSMRTFDANTGAFMGRKYAAGNYQQQFADVIENATELTVNQQPNLERDCKVRLPESVLAHLQKQVK